MIQYIYNFFKLLVLITFFLPALFIPSTNIAIFYVFSIALFFINLCFNKKFLPTLKLMYIKTPFKYFVFFVLWIIFSESVLLILGKYSIKLYFLYLFWTVGVVFFISYLLPVILFKRKVNTLIQVLIISNFIVYVLGILQYLGSELSIPFIDTIISCLSNARKANPYYIQAAGRMYGIFEEPGWFGFFIFINLPLLLNLFNNKYKVFKNTYLNLIIKKVTLPLALICLILTKSPIWLIFNIILLMYWFLKKLSKKIIIITIISLSILAGIIYLTILDSSIQNNIEGTYLNRISVVIQTIFDIDKLVVSEPSFANRILFYIATFKIFCKNWLLGIGLGSTKYYIINIFTHFPLPLTNEIINNIRTSGNNGMMINGAFLWNLLSETGLIGTLLFYLIVFKTINMLKNINKNITGLYLTFNNSLILSLKIFILVSWYDVSYTRILVWFYLGIAIVMHFYVSQNYTHKREIKDEQH